MNFSRYQSFYHVFLEINKWAVHIMLCCLYKKRLPKKEKNSISPIDNPLYLTMYLSNAGAFPFHLAFTNNCLTNLLSQK